MKAHFIVQSKFIMQSEANREKKGKQLQKHYMISDSLSPTSFIKVELKYSLVVRGQRLHRGRCLLPHRKWATEAAWSSREARRVCKRPGPQRQLGWPQMELGGLQSQLVGLGASLEGL